MPHGEIVPEQLIVPRLQHEAEPWLSVHVHERMVVRVEREGTTVNEMVEARERVDYG